MNFDGLTPEQKEMALSCKTPEELLAMAKKMGYKLSDEELDSISGGSWYNCPSDCPNYDANGNEWYC